MTGADSSVNVRLNFFYTYLAQKPDTSHCICSNLDRLGLYADNQIIFGTVYAIKSIWYVLYNVHYSTVVCIFIYKDKLDLGLTVTVKN